MRKGAPFGPDLEVIVVGLGYRLETETIRWLDRGEWEEVEEWIGLGWGAWTMRSKPIAK